MKLYERYLVKREERREKRKLEEFLATKIPLEKLKICELSVRHFEPRNTHTSFRALGKEYDLVIKGCEHTISTSTKILLAPDFGYEAYVDPVTQEEYSPCYCDTEEDYIVVSEIEKFPDEISKTGKEGYVKIAELIELSKIDLASLREKLTRERLNLFSEIYC